MDELDDFLTEPHHFVSPVPPLRNLGGRRQRAPYVPIPRKTAWTKERIALLAELWPTHTAREIAEDPRFAHMTRNAIIGQARRQRLPAKAKNRTTNPAGNNGVKEYNRKKEHSRKREEEMEIEMVPPPPPIEGGVSIFDLEPRHCREVIGTGPDGLARFCGADKGQARSIYGQPLFTLGGHPIIGAYCVFHSRINYRRLGRR